jgi:hypothetical protein
MNEAVVSRSFGQAAGKEKVQLAMPDKMYAGEDQVAFGIKVVDRYI